MRATLLSLNAYVTQGILTPIMLVVVTKTDFQSVSCARIGKRMINCIVLILYINILLVLLFAVIQF